MLKIIDVSQWQGVIDWNKAAQHIDGAVLRAGFGSDDDSQDDKQYSRNAAECERLGIPYEVYLYSYAFTEDMAKSEAAHVLRLIKGKSVSRVWYDLEESKYGTYAKTALKAFADAIRAAGYEVGLYSYENYYNSYLTGVKDLPIWCAKYASNKPEIGADIIAWQYTSGEKIDGIEGRVDCSHWYGDFAKTKAAPKASAKDVYRLYKAARHFYTTDQRERAALISAGWTSEGIGWKSPANGHPVYRYKNGNEYIWTADEEERKALAAAGWVKECLAFRSGKAVPVYRLYMNGDRVYTKDKNERAALIKAGWRDEGTAFYGRK